MTEQTREAVDCYIGSAVKKPGDFLFGGRRGRDRLIATRQYARLVCQWIARVGLDRASLAHTHRAEPRRHSSTAALATCGLKLVPAERMIKGPDCTRVGDSQALYHDRFGSFPAVPAGQRRGRSTSISGPPPRVTRRPDDNALDLLS